MSDIPSGRGWKAVVHDKVVDYVNTSNSAGWGNVSNQNVLKGPNAYWYTWWGNTGTRFFSSGEASVTYPKTESQQLADLMHSYYNQNEVDNLLNVVESPQLPQSLMSLVGTAKTRGVKAALGKISNGFLLYSFGLAPLLNDMEKMAKAAKTFRSDMRKALQKRSETTVIRNSLMGTVKNQSSASHGYGGQADHIMTGELRRTVSARVKSLPLYNSAIMGRLDYCLRRFGSIGPASFVWERIPFSFVVDWFLNTKSTFDHLDNLLTGSSKQMVGDALVTTKGKLYGRMIDKSPGQYPTPGFYGSVVSSSIIEHYKRSPLAALSPKIERHGRFGKKQFALSAALLYQQVANRRS